MTLIDRNDANILEISSIERNSFNHFSYLESLNLTHVKLVKIDSAAFKGLTQLRTLILSWNQISQIELHGFEGLDSLEELWLWGNNLNRIYANMFQHLFKLKRLYINSNQINEIDLNGLRGLNDLEELNLNNNKLTKLTKEFERLVKLKTLYLNENPISLFDSDELQGMDNLKELHLTTLNKSLTLEPNIFANLFKLKMINLNGTNVKKINRFCLFRSNTRISKSKIILSLYLNMSYLIFLKTIYNLIFV